MNWRLNKIGRLRMHSHYPGVRVIVLVLHSSFILGLINNWFFGFYPKTILCRGCGIGFKLSSKHDHLLAKTLFRPEMNDKSVILNDNLYHRHIRAVSIKIYSKELDEMCSEIKKDLQVRLFLCNDYVLIPRGIWQSRIMNCKSANQWCKKTI